MIALLRVFAALTLFAASAHAYVDEDTSRKLLYSGKGQIGLWIAHNEGDVGTTFRTDSGWKTDLPPGTLTDHPPSMNRYKAYCYAQPVSHFDQSAPQKQFCQRYWVYADSYRPGGPIFINDGGEGASDGMFSPGIVTWQWAQKFNGIYIAIEHRYYGWSVPVPDCSTDNLRFLNNKEALQDNAEFIKNWQPTPDVLARLNITDPKILHPHSTPWIYYGGSYPGGRAAHMRVLYPDLVHGAVSSSGVTLASANFPEYFDAPIKYGPPACIRTLQEAIKTIDDILDKPAPAGHELKKMFGLEVLEDDDFANVLRNPGWEWQSRSWSHDGLHDNGFIDKFCPDLVRPGTNDSTIVNGTIAVPASVINFAKYTRAAVADCQGGIEKCYGSYNTSTFAANDVEQEWRLWQWQVCTQWGYTMPAPAAGKPSIVSRRITPEYDLKIFHQAYPPGNHFAMPDMPDVYEVNRLGGLAIAANRLAVIAGDGDPWWPVTPAAGPEYGVPLRTSSTQQPYYLIPDGGHCYDAGTKPSEPKRIQDVHAFQVEFLGEWLKQFKPRL